MRAAAWSNESSVVVIRSASAARHVRSSSTYACVRGSSILPNRASCSSRSAVQARAVDTRIAAIARPRYGHRNSRRCRARCTRCTGRASGAERSWTRGLALAELPRAMWLRCDRSTTARADPNAGNHGRWPMKPSRHHCRHGTSAGVDLRAPAPRWWRQSVIQQ